MTATELPLLTHADRLAEAAVVTAKARQEIETHETLAATVHRLKAAAVANELDDLGAADLVKQSEALRISEIVLPRKQAVLRDAQAAEVAVSLEVLADLAEKVAGLAKDAAQAADSLTAALVDPAAAALDGDTVLARDLGVGRCSVEKAMPGVYPAERLAERIRTASITTWGALHIPGEAAAIVATFDAELAAIRSGINGLLTIHKTAVKVFG